MVSNTPVGIYLIPFFGALLVTVLGLTIKGSARPVALASIFAVCALSLYALPIVFNIGSMRTELAGWAPPLGIELVLDQLAVVASVMVSVSALLIFLGIGGFVKKEFEGRETFFYSTALMLVAGMMGLVLAGDLFNLFVHIEVASLSACALVACGNRGAPRAGLRYLILGSVGASLYLLGVGFLYAAVGSLNMADVALRLVELNVSPRVVLFAALFITVGLCVKIGLFPFHGWMPDAYSLSPNASTALMAPIVTKISAYALLRVLFFVFGPSYLAAQWAITELLLFAGAFAVAFGGIMAFKQSNLRRMFAYSSVAQIGIVIVGIGFVSVEGSIGAILHILNDALMKGALFLATGTLALRYGITEVDDLSGLRGRSPWISATIAVAGLSLIGVPPLAGFFGKWYVLSAALQSGRWEIALLLILGSLATVAYVFKLIEKIYFCGGDSYRKDDQLIQRKCFVEVFSSVVFAILIVAVGVFNGVIVSNFVAPIVSGLGL